MKSANIKPLKACPMCSVKNVFASYEENARYRYECKSCGQYFEFNAPSQLAADVIFNQIIANHTTEKSNAPENKTQVQVTDSDIEKAKESIKKFDAIINAEIAKLWRENCRKLFGDLSKGGDE